ncbi:MAG: choice-of-anchor Q domain-containing protein [Actinomycetota bacterium]
MVTGLAVVGMVSSVVGGATPASANTISVSCPGTDLQTKIDEANPGDTLSIKGTCIGNFTVDKSLTLAGNPTATLDGNLEGTTLTIPTTLSVHLVDLTISGGFASGTEAFGGGIFRGSSGNGTLTLNRVTVQDNRASGPTALGGGIYSANGPVHLMASRVLHNVVSNGSEVFGGGVVSGGPLTLLSSTVSSNRAVATSTGGLFATAAGAGIQSSGPLVLIHSHVDVNHATAVGPNDPVVIGAAVDVNYTDITVDASTINGNVGLARGTGGPGAPASAYGAIGGAIESGAISGSVIANNVTVATTLSGDGIAVGGGVQANFATGLTIDHTRIVGNYLSATGASATAGGGGVWTDGGTDGVLTIRQSTISNNTSRADSGADTAEAVAGGVDVDRGPFSMSGTTVDRNQAVAASDSATASAAAGGVRATSPFTIMASTISRNAVRASAHGSNQAIGAGGGMAVEGPKPERITNSTIANNLVRVVSDQATGDVGGSGGGLEVVANSLLLLNTTVARNVVEGVANTKTLAGGGLFVGAGTTTLKATILGSNTTPGSPNCSGSVESQGNNVLGTTNGCQFSSKPSDKLNVNPKLGVLANNGGPTLTLALLDGSLALDRIPSTACAVSVDQRGVHRPQGPKCDVGAFERNA